jgi:hypothetical protein
MVSIVQIAPSLARIRGQLTTHTHKLHIERNRKAYNTDKVSQVIMRLTRIPELSGLNLGCFAEKPEWRLS